MGYRDKSYWGVGPGWQYSDSGKQLTGSSKKNQG